MALSITTGDCFGKGGFHHVMKDLRIVTLILAVVSLFLACSTSQTTAMRELDELDIPFTAPAFVDRAGRGDLRAVRLFLDGGMKPDSRNLLDQTALLASASRGRTDVVQLLLERGADPNLRFDTHFSKSQVHGLTVLMAAAEQGHAEVVRALLERGAFVNARADNGLTALMAAASSGHGDIVEILLKNDADPNAQTADGETALMFAERGGFTEIVQLLQEAGTEE